MVYFLIQISVAMWLLSWGISRWKEGCGYSRYHITSHGHWWRLNSWATPLKCRRISVRKVIVTPCGTPRGRQYNGKNNPRMAVVPYAAVEWISKGGWTPNELIVWLEEIIIKDRNFQKEDWELFFEFSMADSKMGPNDKDSSVLDMEMNPVTATDPTFGKWTDQLLDATMWTRPEDIHPPTGAAQHRCISRSEKTLQRLWAAELGICFRHNISNIVLRPPLVHRRDAGSYTLMGTHSSVGVFTGLHRDWNPNNLVQVPNLQVTHWQPSRDNGRYDLLCQDKWDWYWHSGVLRQAVNWGYGQDKIQPSISCCNVLECGKWGFAIDGDTKE